jgi:DNA-binding MarR family transcriptional regulator
MIGVSCAMKTNHSRLETSQPIAYYYAIGCELFLIGGQMNIPNNNHYVLFGGSFVLANKLQLVADKTVKGISVKQWFLMRNLADMPTEPPPTITSLANETDTSRQNITKILTVLERQGYVILGNDSDDRRSRTVMLTDHGRSILSELAVNVKPFMKKLFAGIKNEECDIAGKVMLKMIQNLMNIQEKLP